MSGDTYLNDRTIKSRLQEIHCYGSQDNRRREGAGRETGLTERAVQVATGAGSWPGWCLLHKDYSINHASDLSAFLSLCLICNRQGFKCKETWHIVGFGKFTSLGQEIPQSEGQEKSWHRTLQADRE